MIKNSHPCREIGLDEEENIVIADPNEKDNVFGLTQI